MPRMRQSSSRVPSGEQTHLTSDRAKMNEDVYQTKQISADSNGYCAQTRGALFEVGMNCGQVQKKRNILERKCQGS